jgi:single-stranded DNA-binding protein
VKTVNRVEIEGYVGRDAEQKTEKAPVKFSVATGNESKPDGSGKYPLVFHNITAWTNQFPDAINIKKGEFVRLTGRLNYTKWTGKDGTPRTGVEIVATSITVDPKPITPNLHGVAITDRDIPF